MSEQKIIKCPFCNEGNIVTMYTPKTLIQKYARAASNRKRVIYYKDEKYVLVSDKCPNCGKTRKEIEKALKEGIPPSNEEIIRRLKEAGLPLKF